MFLNLDNMLAHCTRSCTVLLAAAAATVALSGCDSTIFDPEGDCEIHHRLRFKFDYNILFADAFPAHVHSVAVYAFEPDGTYAWMREESGWQLSADGYTMDLDGVDPGEYTLIGWCGMDNGFIGDKPESFTLPRLIPGISKQEELINRMKRDHNYDGSAYSKTDLWPLFHGTTADVVIYPPDTKDSDGRTVTYQMSLKKNTNRVRVILQQLGAQDIDADNFSYTIDTANGTMAHHNGLLEDENITYHPWNKGYGFGGLILNDTDPYAIGRDETSQQVKVAVADLTVGRLIKDHPTTLTVHKPDGGVCAKIPLVDYALLTKGNYDTPMGDQEFLDRQDTYTLTFFLDKNYKWSGASIYINSWRVNLTDYEVGNH